VTLPTVDLDTRIDMAQEWFEHEPEKRARVERAIYQEEIERLRAQVEELRARLGGAA
jgi:hypothetical protein